MRKLLFLSFMLLSCQFVYANGYQVLLQGNKETAMGNAGVGSKPSATATFFNPGALGFLESSEIQIGGNGVFGRTNFAPDNSFQQYEARPNIATGYLYAVYAKDSASRWRAALGVTTPFGSLVEWEDDWYGKNNMQRLKLVNVSVQPTFAYRITDKLSVGAGLNISFGHVNLQRGVTSSTLPGDGYLGDFELDGKSEVAFGYNVGIFYQPVKQFSIGLNYRSKVDAKVENGDVNWSNEDASAFATLGALGAGKPTQFSAEIPLPSVFTIGLAAYPTERITMAFDIGFVGWSEYEDLTFEFNNNFPTSVNERNFDNSTVLHLGLEYMATEKLAVRGGFYYDETPVPSGYMTPETPDAPARGYTAGLGYSFSDKVSLDLSFLYLDKEERRNDVPDGVVTNGLNGWYKTSVLIPGFGLSFKL